MKKYRLQFSPQVFTLVLVLASALILSQACAQSLPPWKEGYLDIHHINTGNGDAAFMVFPDGTTLLFDAGDLDEEAFQKKNAPLLATSTFPDNSKTAGGWIADYISKVSPNGRDIRIDYGMISHFHSDHYGSIVELGELIPIGKMIDRDYPDYDFPLDMKEYLKNDKMFMGYLRFLEENKISAEALRVGRDDQIVLLNNTEFDFKVRNVKAGAVIWTGEGNKIQQYFQAADMVDYYKGKYNENPLSLAIKISYGDFDYFTGGDNTGLQGFGLPKWFDVETPMANAVGKVEVTTLNHHGNRDATNSNFVEKLDPKVVVEQTWCSDHPGQEVYSRLVYHSKQNEERHIFATYIHPETKVTYGPWFNDNYKSMKGHIVIRVMPGGKEYYVFILNEGDLNVVNQLGPYHTD